MSLDAHLVSHTHWDREWYHPVERFRQRLVALVDELLDDPPREHESFLLDGQAIILEDYAAVRPDRVSELASALARGKLEAGPWYVLADELIPSGEALVRNLLTGRRVLRRFGARAPSVLYCPDSFGHPAALPAIAAGFGLPVIVLWRGYGGPHWPAGDTVRWMAPGGEVVLVHHLPRDGYEFASHLPVAPAQAAEGWTRMRAELAPRAATGVVLLPHGADHHARQPAFREAIAALERTAGAEVHQSSLTAFGAALLASADDRSLPAIEGELRDSYGYTWCLQGTFATRAHEKRLNADAERQLIRDVEPWVAMAGHHSRSTRAARSALIDAAWATLLRAHPHDTLCGCSIDRVALAMETRGLSAVSQAEGIREDAIRSLIGHDAVAARVARDRWTPVVVVRNAAPRRRSGVVVFEIEEWLADVPVGPGSGPTADTARAVVGIDRGERAAAAPSPRVPSLGRLQVLSSSNQYALIESPRHYPDNDLVRATEVAAWIPDLPSYGIAAWPIDAGTPTRAKPPMPVSADRRELRNGLLTIRISDEGTVSLEQSASGRRIDSLLELMDERDAGDLYTPAPRRREYLVEFRGAKRVHRGPLRGEIALRYRITDRAARKPIAEVSVHLVLDAGSTLVRARIAGENQSTDHRLRLVMHTDVVNGDVWADAAFGVVRRTQMIADAAAAAVETPPRTAPLHRYVSVFNASMGATLVSDGLGEYEATDNGSLIVTLVRAVGELSRADIPERPGHAGWPRPTPGAQCLGSFGAEVAVVLHGPRSAAAVDEIERAADDVLNPLAASTLRSALNVPPTVRGPELHGIGLAMSAIKTSEDGEWLVLRCLNLTDERVDGAWRLPFDVREAHLARLDETIIQRLSTAGGAVTVSVGRRGIHTVLVR